MLRFVVVADWCCVGLPVGVASDARAQDCRQGGDGGVMTGVHWPAQSSMSGVMAASMATTTTTTPDEMPAAPTFGEVFLLVLMMCSFRGGGYSVPTPRVWA